MVHLSIVVPVTGPQSQLDETLVSVLENRPNDCEVILVHPESYVDRYDLGDEVRFVVTPSAALLSMVNAGFAASRGELIHLLCPGGIATAGWCEPACDMFRDNQNVATLAPQLIMRGKRIIRGIAYNPAYGTKLVRKRSAFPLMPTRLAGFYQSSALRFMKGFDLHYDSLAEVELGIRFRSAGYKTTASDACQIEMLASPNWKSTMGFRGGQLRAKLFQSAKRARLVSSRSYPLSCLGEVTLHACRPSLVPALLGHAMNWFDTLSDSNIDVVSVPAEKKKRTPAATNNQKLRKAG